MFVAIYSTPAPASEPVATPLGWDEFREQHSPAAFRTWENTVEFSWKRRPPLRQGLLRLGSGPQACIRRKLFFQRMRYVVRGRSKCGN